MKPEPSIRDVATGITQRLGQVPGVSNLSVTVENTVITVAAQVSSGSRRSAQDIIDGYTGDGFSVVYDRRSPR